MSVGDPDYKLAQHQRNRYLSNLAETMINDLGGMMKIATVESDHQKAVIKWADDMVKFQPKKYWMLKFLYACPNEGQHKVQYRVHQKAMGVKAGVPDLCLPYPIYNEAEYSPPDVKWHGLFVEMKSKDTKGRLSDDQKRWIEYLTGQGYRVEVCWSADEAIKVLEDYLG